MYRRGFVKLDRPDLSAAGISSSKANFYRILHRFARSEVEVRFSPRAVEIFLMGGADRRSVGLACVSMSRSVTVDDQMRAKRNRATKFLLNPLLFES